MEDCVFCKIVSGEIPGEKILESENFIVIRDVHPKVSGHSLVISKKHFKNFLDLPSLMYGDFLEISRRATFELMKETKAEGFNLVMNNFGSAGQIVPHVHLHILPRKAGDGFRVSV